MQRLIDANALVEKAYWHGEHPSADNPFAEGVDAVIPVRCKDCKHLMFSDCYGECRIGHMGIVQPDDFFSRGERKDEE